MPQTMTTHKPIIRSASVPTRLGSSASSPSDDFIKALRALEEEDKEEGVFDEVDEITKKIQTAAKLTSAMLDRSKNPSSRKSSGCQPRRVRFSIDLGSAV